MYNSLLFGVPHWRDIMTIGNGMGKDEKKCWHPVVWPSPVPVEENAITEVPVFCN